MTADKEIAMQSRCIHCLGEHYAPNVIAISYGEAVCHNCGRFSREMPWADYVEALSAARERIALENNPLPRQRGPIRP